ncbi:hypothetical protein BH11CYA1_BH11CYA1_48730 [soil metagenome]
MSTYINYRRLQAAAISRRQTSSAPVAVTDIDKADKKNNIRASRQGDRVRLRATQRSESRNRQAIEFSKDQVMASEV